MVDSASKSKNLSENNLYDFSAESNKHLLEKFVENLQVEGSLSEAELKFLSRSKEKKSSAKTIQNILHSKLTLENYKEILCLQEYTPFGGTINPEQAVRNIRYNDESGIIVATVQIDTINKKIRMQNLGNILPTQECFTPYQVGTKVQNLAKFNNWSTEDGGINQFNGNIEIRYKDKHGNVMAAIIKKENGLIDTVVEYKYKSGNRYQMILTNYYGQSTVVYDGTEKVNQVARIDVDNGGSIVEITKVFSD